MRLGWVRKVGTGCVIGQGTAGLPPYERGFSRRSVSNSDLRHPGAPCGCCVSRARLCRDRVEGEVLKLQWRLKERAAAAAASLTARLPLGTGGDAMGCLQLLGDLGCFLDAVTGAPAPAVAAAGPSAAQTELEPATAGAAQPVGAVLPGRCSQAASWARAG
jgi:hypothetical protein